jgi:hypothetical protein
LIYEKTPDPAENAHHPKKMVAAQQKTLAAESFSQGQALKWDKKKC